MRDTHLLETLPDIRSMGPMLMDPVWSQHRHTTTCCELIHVIRGRVRVDLPRGRVRGAAGDTLWIPSGTQHRDEFDPAEGLHVFMVFFTWPGERVLLRQAPPASLPGRCAPAAAELGRAFDRLRARQAGGSDMDCLLARADVHALLLLMLNTALSRGRRRVAEAAGARRRRQLMIQARAYLDAHYAEPLSLDRIAVALGVSPFYLSHVFSQESAFSLFAYLTTLRMNRARALLRDGRLSVKEAAHRVGYEDEHYFSRVFRRHVGCAPREARG